jgi:lipopolysaccharide biosynthesis protein
MDSIRKLYRRARDTTRHHLWTFWERQPDSRKHAVRNLFFTHASSLFSGTPPYEQWQKAKSYFDRLLASQVDLINISTINDPGKVKSKRLAIHAHIYYPELAPDLAQYLSAFPSAYDLYISTPFEQDRQLLASLFSKSTNLGKLNIAITPNRGRDLAPMFVQFGKQLLDYDYVCHIHTKKSVAANSIGQVWRNYLWDGLLSNQDHRLQKIWHLLDTHALVYPQKFHWIDVNNCQWGTNYSQGIELCQNLGLNPPTEGFIEFPAGSMFWARVDAIAPLIHLDLRFEDFDDELGQTDHTLAHTLERLIGYLPLVQGKKIALLQNPLLLNHYP